MAKLQLTAQIAVSAAVSIDKLYSYTVPAGYLDSISVGQRVIVPFGKGNRSTPGFVVTLDVHESLECSKLKSIAYLYEDLACLSPEEFEIASFLKNRCFCSFFDAANALMPPGVWKTSDKKLLKKSPTDQKILTAFMAMSLERASELLPPGKIGQHRMEVLKCLSQAESLPEKELSYLTGAGSTLIKNLAHSGFIRLEYVEAYRRPETEQIGNAPEIILSAEQTRAYDKIKELLFCGKPKGALLYGVTGSGKTEVYIKLIKDAVKKGKSAILLVPEIALTPQMVRRFCMHFGDDVAIVHSGLTAVQRYDEYKRIKRGDAKVVVGTRTAVFAPLQNLGLIIVDEEQEFTYKSENTPRYHAAQVAKYRIAKNNGLVLLGSATPSVETFWQAKNGQIDMVKLESRFNEQPLPKTIVSDMRGKLKKGEIACIGEELQHEIEDNLNRGEKTILFLNRRGASRRLVCIDCGYSPECKKCSVSLVYHSKNNRLLCHHCGYSEAMPKVCPKCGSEHMKYEGIGTQRVEEELSELFPGIRIIRMDADTIVGRTSHEKLLDDFAKGDGDVLLGTQMVAKGLDFEKVSLVGVLDSDGFMYSGDFRAQERAFSLITQVVGRAGRHKIPGRAVIQTYCPDNSVILSAAKQDYDSFYEYEIAARKALKVPPFEDIFVFTLSGSSEETVYKSGLALAATISQSFKSDNARLGYQVLGPVAPAIARINNKYRFTVSFRGKNNAETRMFVEQLLEGFKRSEYNRKVSAAIDINPYN